MLLTKTFLATAAIAGGLLVSPPAAARPQRIPEPPPPLPRAQRSECTVGCGFNCLATIPTNPRSGEFRWRYPLRVIDGP
jgi:hypothetical protein